MESIFIYAIAVAAQDSTSVWDKLLGFCEAREAALVPIGVVLVIALVLNIVQAIAMRTWSKRMKFKGFRWTSGVAKCLSAPLGWAIWVIGATIALQIFIEPEAQERAANLIVERVGQIRMGFILLLGGWFMGRLVRYFERMLGDIANESDKVDLTIVRALGNFMIIGVWLLVLLVALQTYGVNMAAIITIGGAGGFALTFAFQDVFKNFFGGIMILLSRPFKIGEGIQVSSVTGTVEKIGMYQTTVRGWDAVPFILPNSMFLTNPIVNFGKRAQRRYQFDLGLRYEDFARVEPVVKGIETFLDAHPLIDPHRAHRVYFSLYGDSSLNISVTCYAVPETGDTSWYKLQQEVMLGIGNIVSEHGADFAFPTTTIDYPGAPVPPAK